MSPANLIKSLKKVNGSLESYWWLRLKLKGDSAFQKRWGQWQNWIEQLEAHARKPLSGSRILVFSTASSWMDFSMAMGLVVAGYGSQVDYVWLPYTGWGPSEKFFFERRYERWAKAHRPPLERERIKVISLLSQPLAPLEDWMEREAASLARLDTQYEARTEEVEISPGGAHWEIYSHRLERNRLCIQGLTGLMKSGHYSKVIVANGQVMELGACYRTARHHGIPCTTFEMFERNGYMGFNTTIPASNSDTSEAWQADAPHLLTKERWNRVSGLLKGREGTDWEGYCVTAQSQAKASVDQLKEHLKITTERVALACPNVSWDSSVLGVGRSFSSMVDWLRFIVTWFARQPEWTLVVRCHPGENLWGTNQPSESVVRKLYPDGLPPNIRLIPAGDKTNTYGLMDMADLGLVFTSTTGIEMAARSIPVITAGWVHYGQRGFTADPDSEDSFAAALESAVSSPRRLSEPERDLIYCYLDVYFHNWPRRFPWHLTFAEDIHEWTVARVLSDEGHQLFGETFEFLANC